MIYYVDINARGEGNGSKESPFKYINDAAKIAVAGDEIVVRPGIYREYVDPVNAGTEDAPIVYRSEEPLGAIITGAEVVKSWKPFKDNVWVCEIANSIFGSYNPYTTKVGGDWYFSRVVRHTGSVFLDDKMLYETESLEECIKGEVYEPSWDHEFSVYKWFTEQSNHDTTLIYANFQGKNPNEENVDIAVRRNCFFPSKTGVNYITLRGFNVNKAATTWAPPAAFQDGMVGPHWSKGWIIEDCEISNSKCVGISLGKYLDPENDQYFTKFHDKSPTQMERDAVCRGQYHGWLKENIGHHTVRRCHIHHCEQAGIVGRMGCVFSVIEDNHIHNINNMHQICGAEVAGIKFHAAIDVVFRRNHIHHCTMGIWCDWQAQGTRITQNFLHDNITPDNTPMAPGAMGSQDIFLEVGHGPTLLDNNILLSKESIRFATEGIAFVHNLILGAFTSVGSGVDSIIDGVNQPRYTPYHIQHRTEVAGFMTILHGDNRFYNNIFVQKWPVKEAQTKEDMGFVMTENQVVGTSIFNGYPTEEEWKGWFDFSNPENFKTLGKHHFSHLPIWSKGNAYLNGAKAWENETNAWINDSEKIYVDVVEENGKFLLKTNIFDVMKDCNDSVINSDTLGNAFEPNQRFEDSDGSCITFDRDYFGNHRGISTIPGPFADPKELEQDLVLFDWESK